MIVKLLTGNHLEFLSLKVDCTGSSESTIFFYYYSYYRHVNNDAY